MVYLGIWLGTEERLKCWEWAMSPKKKLWLGRPQTAPELRRLTWTGEQRCSSPVDELEDCPCPGHFQMNQQKIAVVGFSLQQTGTEAPAMDILDIEWVGSRGGNLEAGRGALGPRGRDVLRRAVTGDTGCGKGARSKLVIRTRSERRWERWDWW